MVIAEHKAPSLSGMPMQISKHKQLAALVFMQYCLLLSVNCWEKLWVRVLVNSIKVYSIYVLAPVATTHTVWIENRDNFEHKVVEQQLALLIR